MNVRISRVIRAQKREIMRMINEVEKFPRFMNNVKEVEVISREKNKIRTRWNVVIDGLPISWVEESSLIASENAMVFKAIEGDLKVFEGKWSLNEHPEGVEVIVDILVETGIPAINAFVDTYIQELIAQNFNAMLEAIEQGIIIQKYENYKSGKESDIAGFGIIGHLYNFNHLVKGLKMLNPDFNAPSREFLGYLFNITPSFKLYDITKFRSVTNEETKGYFIVSTFIPEMIDLNIQAVFEKVIAACKVAEKHGAGIVTLGGFTSIVGERLGYEMAKQVRVPVTTGNTVTSVLVIDGVLEAARMLDFDLKEAKVTIIGGTGDIGSACARYLVSKVKKLVITGRSRLNLQRLKKELSLEGKKYKCSVEATTNNHKAIKNANIVIAAASVVASILDIDDFSPGTIICDVGYPKNISYRITDRKDILIFSGGLCAPPTNMHVPIDIGLPSIDVMYGCFAEAIILALEKRYENFSYGRGNITTEKMDEMRAMANKHGFNLAPFYWGDQLIDEQQIQPMREVMSHG